MLLGLSNTAGVLAGVLGTAATGFILQNGSWKQARTGAEGAEGPRRPCQASSRGCRLPLLLSGRGQGSCQKPPVCRGHALRKAAAAACSCRRLRLPPLHCLQVWGVAVALYLVGTVVWNLFATGGQTGRGCMQARRVGRAGLHHAAACLLLLLFPLIWSVPARVGRVCRREGVRLMARPSSRSLEEPAKQLRVQRTAACLL